MRRLEASDIAKKPLFSPPNQRSARLKFVTKYTSISVEKDRDDYIFDYIV